MTDETETTDGWEGFESEEFTDAEYVEVEGAQIIAPRGWGWLADTFGAAAVRVTMAKGGNIEVLSSPDEGESYRWQDVTKLKQAAALKVLRGDKT